jgi:hypothetical protein
VDKETVVTLKVLDDQHPATKAFPKEFTHKEEIYQFKNFDPGRCACCSLWTWRRRPRRRRGMCRWLGAKTMRREGLLHVAGPSRGHLDEPDLSESSHRRDQVAARGGERRCTPNPDVSNREEEISKKAAEAAGKQASNPRVQEGSPSSLLRQRRTFIVGEHRGIGGWKSFRWRR